MKALTPHISRTSGPVAVEVVRYRSHVQGSLPTNLGSLVLNYTCQHDHATPESAATCQRKIERAFKHAGSAAIRRYGIGLPDRDVESSGIGQEMAAPFDSQRSSRSVLLKVTSRSTVNVPQLIDR